MSRNRRRAERFAQIPLEVLESEACRWLPDFAVRVLLAMAAQYNGFNNGGLELGTKVGRTFAIGEQALHAGIGLLLAAGLVQRTVEARRRSGKGSPARYALTWRQLGDFPQFNIVPTAIASNEWRRFVPPFPPPATVHSAMVALGHRRKPQPIRLHLISGVSPPRYKKVHGALHVKNDAMACSAPCENESFTCNAPCEERVTLHATKNRGRGQ